MRIAMLSGGVGGARLARGLSAAPGVELTAVVNVGDDETVYGLFVSPDLDTVLYTLAGVEGPHGWGRAGDHFRVMDRLSSFPIDTTFQIGDTDLATSLFRTDRLADGWPLSQVTTAIATGLGITAAVLPVSDDRIRTEVLTSDGTWRPFQEYFVLRHHSDPVEDVRYAGADEAKPAPGVLEALQTADAIVVGPSNPPLSIWPILAVPGISDSLAQAPRVLAVSPLIGGKALKGPADRVLSGLGFSAGNLGVVESYSNLLDDLVIDTSDTADRDSLEAMGLTVHVADTRIAEPAAATRLATFMIELL